FLGVGRVFAGAAEGAAGAVLLGGDPGQDAGERVDVASPRGEALAARPRPDLRGRAGGGRRLAMTRLETKVKDFLDQRRIAVVGVPGKNSAHPAANLIYRRLKKTGHEVFAVNPNLQMFENDRCYPDVRAIPGSVDGAVIITRPETTERIVQDCDAAGIRRVWM